MKHGLLLSVLTLLTCSLVAQDPQPITITTTTGKVYKDVKIMKVTPIDLRIIHATGTASVALRELEPELQKRFGYDPSVLGDELKKRAEEDQKAREYIAEEKRRVADEEKKSIQRAAAGDALAASGTYVTLRISQVTADGVALATAGVLTQNTFANRTDKSSLVANGVHFKTVDARTIAVVGLPRGTVDGDKWTGTLHLSGTYTYNTVGAGTKTVREYATTAEMQRRGKVKEAGVKKP